MTDDGTHPIPHRPLADATRQDPARGRVVIRPASDRHIERAEVQRH